MKKTLIIIFSLCSVFASAQKLDNALLWKISGNGLSKPSYLYGTMHMVCDATLDKNILKALDDTNQLYLEYDMDSPTLGDEMATGVMMKDGKKMSSLVSAEDFKAASKFIETNFGGNLTTMEEYKPFMVIAMMYPKMLDCPIQSFENELIRTIKEQHEEVYGLETVHDQMQIFDDIPYDVQMQELVRATKEFEKDKAEFKKMTDAYSSKDLNGLMAIMESTNSKMYLNYKDILTTNRNRKWIPGIEKAAKENPTFFGVGAAHLVGDQGLINLLRKKGYKVEAVK